MPRVAFRAYPSDSAAAYQENPVNRAAYLAHLARHTWHAHGLKAALPRAAKVQSAVPPEVCSGSQTGQIAFGDECFQLSASREFHRF
jgi:hypothetical protein